MPINRDYASFLTSFGSGKFQSLWPAQAHVLNAYSAEYTATPDVAVDLPTGGGKTLIALLVAESWRQEGKKVAILSANKTLARQMKREAESSTSRPHSWREAGPLFPLQLSVDTRAHSRLLL